ncbi:MAG: DUF4301 family protein [Bacteroidales bacterium]|nr:DUF4301 family protein [Bacteroidales bacterium]MBN2820210.1 DUF4301 family protein [Bacteroidales bacterium]
MFKDNDLKQFREKGISEEKINWQIQQFTKGVIPINLIAPATFSKGIKNVYNEDHYLHYFKNNKSDKKITKFVPASGAASRMFKDLFEFREKFANNPKLNIVDYPFMQNFFSNLKKFAFYTPLDKSCSKEGGLEVLVKKEKYDIILNKLLGEEGLNYGFLPKGLLKFHYDKNGIARTPFEEHLIEGALYASSNGRVNIHYTVSPEHMSLFKELMNEVVPEFEKQFNVKYNIGFSIQKPSTDTMAVTKDNLPFYEEDGSVLFRPGGHGALIENLNDIDSDIVFIKNIDNVVPQSKAESTVKYKSILAGVLLEVQESVFKVIKELKSGADVLKNATEILKKDFNIEGFATVTEDAGADYIYHVIERLNRPIRVCGVVKNQGEPGGGPFIVKNENGVISPQIVEASQVDLSNFDQSNILKSATHFNPVDLVCGIKNYKGEKFDLTKYVDDNTCFISNKSKSGRELKALELPGLWNGAMAGWNTIFIEVPVDTFNPVKTVNDLLRPNHQ